MHLALSHMTILALLSAALLIAAGAALVQRSRGTNVGRNRGSASNRGGGRRSAGPRGGSRLAATPSARFAAGSRFASQQGGAFAVVPHFAATPAGVFTAAPHFALNQASGVVAAHNFAPIQVGAFAAAVSIAPGRPSAFAAAPHPAAELRVVPDLQLAPELRVVPELQLAPELRVVPERQLAPELRPAPDPHLVSPPDPRVAVPATSWSVGPVASVSVLAVLTEGDRARPAFAPSNSGDAFPTRLRALSLLGAHLLAALSIFTFSLAATPIGHHIANVGSISVWSLAALCLLVGVVFDVAVAARVQHDIMGGGWDGGFSLGFISYISPEVALYVIRPSGISAAARRLNSSPARVILVEYGLLVAAFLIVLHRLVGR